MSRVSSVAGTGRVAFEERAALELMGVTPYAFGVVLLRYRRAGGG